MIGSQVKFEEPLIGRQHPFLEGGEALKLRHNACAPRGIESQAAAEEVHGREASFGDNTWIPVVTVPAVDWPDGAEAASCKIDPGPMQVFLATLGFSEDDAHSGAATPDDLPEGFKNRVCFTTWQNKSIGQECGVRKVSRVQ